MNLVQIQERLKDMPLQAVMQYANGMNPEVPPYLALGELNRRKKMEQSMQPAEMPQGTIKEQLEQEVGLALHFWNKTNESTRFFNTNSVIIIYSWMRT